MKNKPLWKQLWSRRDIMRMSAQGGVALLFSGGATRSLFELAAAADPALSPEQLFVRDFGPINRLLGDDSPTRFSGDNNERPHRILWAIDDYLKNRKPESEEEVPLVIVGGGMSGLFSAYTFRKHKPIVLEQAARFGGNAKGESWRGLAYSIGAAYIDLPRPGTPMHEFYQALNLEEIMVPRPTSDPVEYKGKIYQNFWEGETEPKFKAQYAKMNSFFGAVLAEKERPFPFIPSLSGEQRESVKYYDRYSLHEHLMKVMGGKIPPHLETALEYYCWSTYAGSATELSAGAVLNFLAQESNPIRIGAGGNARIGERILERLVQDVPRENLRPGSLVVQVKTEGDRVHVLYEDAGGKLRKVKAKCAIMACPKFIAAKVMPGLEPERFAAIKRLRYRSYMTAHVLLKKKLNQKFYDLFMVGDGKIDLKNIKEAQNRVNGTDFVLGNFAQKDANVSILTFYRAFPFDGARAELNQPGVYEDYKKRFEQQMTRQILPMLKIPQSDIFDIRLTLWGHALPLAGHGLYSDNTIETLRKPFGSRVFFVEQDNWAYPSTQTGATDVVLMRDQIRAVLG